MICTPPPPLRSTCLYCIRFLMRFSVCSLESSGCGRGSSQEISPHLHPIFNGYGPACPWVIRWLYFPSWTILGKKWESHHCYREVRATFQFQGKKTRVKISAGLTISWKELQANFHPQIMFQREICSLYYFATSTINMSNKKGCLGDSVG